MREVIFEHIVEGPAVRVAAVDVETGLEVVIVGPATAARADLERVALAKLKWAAARANETVRPARPRPRRGDLV